jgi:ankyrin repeat protein
MNEDLASALEKKSLSALKKALATKPDLSALNSSGLSALHLAVKGKKLDLAEALLAAGADINVKDEDSNTPLYALLKSKSGALNPTEEANAKWLVEKGADLNVPGDYGFTALHFAARSSGAPLVKWLIEKGAKVLRDKGDATPLHQSLNTHSKDTEMWELFLANGCSVKDVNASKETLLHRAVVSHNPTAAKWFLAKGVDAAAKDKDGLTALDYAKKYNSEKLIKILS